MPANLESIKKRFAGAFLIGLGAVALTTPRVADRWSLALLGLPLIAMGIAEAYAAFTSPRGSEASAYLPGVLALLAGNVLLLSSALALRGLLILLMGILAVAGLGKIVAAWRSHSNRLPLVLNGIVDFGCAAVIWYLGRFIGSVQAVGVVVGAYIVAAGWRLLMAPVETAAPDTADTVLNVHPDPNSAFREMKVLPDCVSRPPAGRSSCAPPIYCGCRRSGSCFWRSMPAGCH